MGLPYSKQIHAAFDQVTPLVAAGFEVLQTTKDIAILLAVIQVIVAITLILILIALVGLLFSVNEDLAMEREQLVTPVLKWLASWVFKYGRIAKWVIRIALVLGTIVFAWSIGQGLSSGHNDPKLEGEEGDESEEKVDGDDSKDEKDAKDDK
jgi:hypothetical protein